MRIPTGTRQLSRYVPIRRLIRRLPAALLVAAVSCALLCAETQASPPIEAVWAFNGGEVAIVHQDDGSYAGIVEAPTTFARCPHAVGERMWTEMRPQPDGSYWGLHQWFFETEACQPNPTLGPAAWRVVTDAGGTRSLLVCFSNPGTSQPRIPAAGTNEAVTYGCYESARLAGVPTGSTPSSRSGVADFRKTVGLPGNRVCLSRRAFRIHLHSPRFDPIAEVVVRIRGRRVAVDRRGTRFSSEISLRGLPRGAFTVSVHITTVLGHHLSGRRTYHTCVPTRRRTRRAGH